MMQKVVMKIPPNCAKCQIKVRKILATIPEIQAIGLEGSDHDRLVVFSDGVDWVTQLMKKSVEEVHDNTDKKDDEGGGEKKDKGGGGMGGGGSDKKEKPDDSEKKDKEGGGRSGEKNDKANGELRKMGANKVFGGWFTYGPSTCAEANLHELRREFACFCTNRLTIL